MDPQPKQSRALLRLVLTDVQFLLPLAVLLLGLALLLRLQ